MKNTFYFSLKNLSFLKNLNICPTFFVHLGKSLDKKTKVDFEIMNLKSEKQTVAIHILSNISKRKGNQTTKFGQLIQYNVGDFFIKNHADREAGRLFQIS